MGIDNMKDSGYQWIGDIPNNWKISRILQLLKIPITDGPHTTPEMYDEGIPFVSAEAVSTGNGKINFDNIWGYISEDFYKECCRKYKPEINDIYMIKSGATTGKVSILEEDIVFNIWSPLAVFRTDDNKMLPKFMFYSLQANFFQMQVQLGWTYGTQQNISMRTLEHLKICVPPIDEQILIVNYLDVKCGKLDEIIADLEKQITTINNLKVSLINELVTKGLKENLEYKDSGVSWIGKIPSYWDISRILQLLKMPITDGPHTTPEMYDEGIPFVSAEAVSTGNGKINFDNIWGYISEDFYKECCRKYKPEVNDIYMIKSGATTGRVSILEEDVIFNIWSPLAVFRVNDKKMLPKFMFYSLQANFFQMQVQLGWTYGTQQNIGMRTLEHLKICVPPICEQKLIVEHLDTKCTELNNILECKQKQLEHMKQYKSSLIYEYVTGKKRVKVGE